MIRDKLINVLKLQFNEIIFKQILKYHLPCAVEFRCGFIKFSIHGYEILSVLTLNIYYCFSIFKWYML